jgi:ADP-ribose pyrophosphatase
MKIPDNAEKVFNGVIFDVYQWKQKMFDGSCETFEALKRPNTINVIPIVDGKIVLLNEQQPCTPVRYSLVGGRQENNESEHECAKRELLEETGLESDNWEKLIVFEPYFKMEWKIFVYIARECKKVSEVKHDAGERIDIYEYDFDEFVEKIVAEDFWGKDFSNYVLRLSYDNKLDELRNKLLG